jgi:hypothetical protein
MTLTEFLLARIAEDEETARAAQPALPGDAPQKWLVNTQSIPRGERFITQTSVRNEGNVSVARGSALVMEYVVWFDPVHVLAECEAKRRIVEGCSEIIYNLCSCDELGTFALDTVELLALSYADHPDFRQEWRP